MHQHEFFLGSEDPDYCVLSYLGAWFEIHFHLQPDGDNPSFLVSKVTTMPTPSKAAASMLSGVGVCLKLSTQGIVVISWAHTAMKNFLLQLTKQVFKE